MYLIAYVTNTMVTTLTMPSEVVCVVLVAMQAMAKTMAIAMAVFIDGSVAISNLNIITGCIFQ